MIRVSTERHICARSSSLLLLVARCSRMLPLVLIDASQLLTCQVVLTSVLGFVAASTIAFVIGAHVQYTFPVQQSIFPTRSRAYI